MLSRRDLLRLSGAAAVSASLPAPAAELPAADYTLEIAAAVVELSPRHRLGLMMRLNYA